MFEEEDKTFIRETFSTHANEIKKEVKTEISSIKKEMASFNNRCHDTHKEVDDRINSNSKDNCFKNRSRYSWQRP